ncbi:hypothetical protein KDU71_09200 [Carboxylicivirga sediminis]|uniref:Uncharacterized protein n=1 Tax=Carboxylicivirga sediminis TaxID=2006564 RepID=A0A941F5Q5_9BACT|nr:hypothetical protein [Carboxylicivirga sediminis]MBR8535730.1 hypothetical protein [Carboxylicivirga sediminis]
MQQSNSFYWIIILVAAISMAMGNLLWSSIGLGLAAYFFMDLLSKMGKNIPIIELMATMAALQWIVGPFIDYHNDSYHYKYHMYVEESTYMAFVVPSVLAFWLGTRLFKQHSDLEEIGERVRSLLENYPRLPFIMVGVGLLIPYLSPLLPASLGFVFYLLANIKYIGVIYLLFSDNKNRWPVFWGTMAFTAIASIAAGMFHDLLLWAILSFTFVARELHLSLVRKFSFAIAGVILAMSIQSVKAEYRNTIWQGYTGNKLALFTSLVVQQWSTGSIVNPNADTDANVRLNQGWIISAIMKHVPEKEPYANGSTVTEAIESSLLPRFLAPNKKTAGGRENYERFTGFNISQSTSMGISLVGEGYANYGVSGGILFMFIWGVFIAWFWQKLWRLSAIYPTLLLWSPILFLQVIKAETEF